MSCHRAGTLRCRRLKAGARHRGRESGPAARLGAALGVPGCRAGDGGALEDERDEGLRRLAADVALRVAQPWMELRIGVLTALFTDAIAARIKTIGRAGRVLYMVAGGVMVLMGVAVMTGQMSRMAYWMLQTFPSLNFTLV